jgi:hypothetical protein
MKAGKPRTWAVAIALALAALGIGAASSAGLAVIIDVEASKHRDGPYEDAQQQVNIPVGKEKSLYWRVKNFTAGPLDLTFDDAATGGSDTDGYRIRWYRGRNDISSQVKGSGYPFKLKAGKKKIFRAEVKHKLDVSPGFCIGGQASPPPDDAYFAVDAGSCA